MTGVYKLKNSHSSWIRISMAVVIGCLGVFAVVHARAQVARKQDAQATQNGQFRFGSVLLSHYDSIKGNLSSRVEVIGPKTTVETTDPKVKDSKTELFAAHIIATRTGTQKANDIKEVVEAMQHLRFVSSRPSKDGGVQTIRGTATKGTYFKTEARIVLAGPVHYHGEVHDDKGNLIESVDGDSDSGELDENNQILTLSGAVSMKATMPNLERPAELKGASKLVINFSERPITFELKHGTISAQPKEAVKKDK